MQHYHGIRARHLRTRARKTNLINWLCPVFSAMQLIISSGFTAGQCIIIMTLHRSWTCPGCRIGLDPRNNTLQDMTWLWLHLHLHLHQLFRNIYWFYLLVPPFPDCSKSWLISWGPSASSACQTSSQVMYLLLIYCCYVFCYSAVKFSFVTCYYSWDDHRAEIYFVNVGKIWWLFVLIVSLFLLIICRQNS